MDLIKDNDLLDLQITDETKTQLTEIAKWTNIYAIVAFASLGITILTTILAIGKASKFGIENVETVVGTSLFTVVIVGGLTLLLNIALYNAAKNLKLGLDASDQGFFNQGMRKLNSYFKITGILFIIFMGFFVLMLLIAILAGLTGAFRS